MKYKINNWDLERGSGWPLITKPLKTPEWVTVRVFCDEFLLHINGLDRTNCNPHTNHVVKSKKKY